MKQLIFIDNDSLEAAKDDSTNLEYLLNDFDIPMDGIQYIDKFYFKYKEDPDKMQEIIFNPNNIICTWSMYTVNHFGSLQQITSILKMAGRNDIRNQVYISSSSQLKKALRNHIDNIQQAHAVLSLLKGIEGNYILSKSGESGDLIRLRVDLTKDTYDMIHEEEISKEEIYEIFDIK